MSNTLNTSEADVREEGKTSSLVYNQPKAGLPLPLDMTDILKYEAMVPEVARVNNMNGPFLMKEFLLAKELVSACYCKVMFEYETARDESKRAAAVAYLEKAPSWLETHNRKVTEAACQAYADMDPEYLMAKEKESYLKSLSTFLQQKMLKFQSAHDDIKAIYKGTLDSKGFSGALPTGQDSQ